MESNKSISKTPKKPTTTTTTTTGTSETSSVKDDLRDDQDHYCWVCHKEKVNLCCNICPRSYHLKCLNNNPSYSQLDSYTLINDKSFIKDNWVCFECELISKAESDESRSECLRRITKDEFGELLNYAVMSIKKSTDVTFHSPVDLETYKDYTDFIVHPMDFFKIDQYVKTKKYASTEAFLSDCKWILHNCYIYNQAQNPLTLNARYMLKIAKNEIYELETCPDCYSNFYKYDIKEFFIQTCSYPHNLVLAKLKGHPMWPSKVVKYNEQTKEAEVRFFGAHDKAWVSLDNCLMISEIPSTSRVNKNQRTKLELAIKELEAHIKLLDERFPNLFKFSPPKTTLQADQVFLIPLPKHITSPTPVSYSTTSSSTVATTTTTTTPTKNDTSSMNESLISAENNNTESTVTQPPVKKQATKMRKSAVTPSPTSLLSAQKQAVKKEQLLSEQEFSSLNDDSDDTEHKLVIDDELSENNKKRPPSKRKRVDSTSSNKSSSVSSVQTNSNVRAKKSSTQTIDRPPPTQPAHQEITKPQQSASSTPVLPKKKMKKSLNDSAVSQNYQQKTQLTDNEKLDQLVKQNQYLKEELDRSRALHIEEIKDMFENHKSEFRELKMSLEAEKAKALSNLRKELEQEHAKQIEEIKKKSWCTNCLKQAGFFCCRLASYCSYECQSQHWVTHMNTCLQNKEKATGQVASTAVESDQQSESDQNSSSVQDSSSTSIKNATSDKEIVTQERQEQDKAPQKTVIESTDSLSSTKKPSDQKADHDEKPAVEVVEKTTQVKKIKQIIEEKHEPIKLHPEKPKDRFLKKLNKSSLLESTKSPSPRDKEPVETKDEEKKEIEKASIDSSSSKEDKKVEIETSHEQPKESSVDKSPIEDEKSKDKPSAAPSTTSESKDESAKAKTTIAKDKPASTTESKDEPATSTIVESKDKSASTTKPHQEPDELEQMRQKLMRKLLESKKAKEQKQQNKDLNKGASKSADDCSMKDESKINEAENKKVKEDKKVEDEKQKTEDKREEAVPAQVVVETAKDKQVKEVKVEKKEAPKISLVKYDVDLSEESDSEDEVKSTTKEDKSDVDKKSSEKVEEEEFDDDSNLMAELLNKKENEETSTSVHRSPIPADINQVTDSLISKVIESEELKD